MIRKFVKRVDSHLKHMCEELSPRSRRWFVIVMLGIFTAGVMCNLILEFYGDI